MNCRVRLLKASLFLFFPIIYYRLKKTSNRTSSYRILPCHFGLKSSGPSVISKYFILQDIALSFWIEIQRSVGNQQSFVQLDHVCHLQVRTNMFLPYRLSFRYQAHFRSHIPHVRLSGNAAAPQIQQGTLPMLSDFLFIHLNPIASSMLRMVNLAFPQVATPLPLCPLISFSYLSYCSS